MYEPQLDEFDIKRKEQNAYKYLCYLEEARNWISEHLNIQDLPEVTEFEEFLRDGVILAKISNHFDPVVVPVNKIFDIDQKYYKSNRLHFRHTDNINHYFRFLSKIGLPSVFYPITTDIYDMKNMPKCIFCLHALSYFLYRKGLAKEIHSLYGVVEFSKEQLNAVQQQLEKYKIDLPNFSKISGILADELSVDEAEMHAAIIAINESFDRNATLCELCELLKNPLARLVNVVPENIEEYHPDIFHAKQQKAQQGSHSEDDVYSFYLTRGEIQARLDFVNIINLMNQIIEHVQNEDVEALMGALMNPVLEISGLDVNLGRFYMEFLRNACDINEGVFPSIQDVYKAVEKGNKALKSTLELGKDLTWINSFVDRGCSDPRGIGDLQNILKRHFTSSLDDCSYFDQLVACKKSKKGGPQQWVVLHMAGNNSSIVYFNLKNPLKWTLNEPANFSDSNWLTVVDIQNSITAVNSAYTRDLFYQANLPAIVSLQSVVKCVLNRRNFLNHGKKLSSFNKQGLILQRTIRAHMVQMEYLKYYESLNISTKDINALQSTLRMLILRLPFVRKMQYFRENIDLITKIQAVFRGARAKRRFNSILYDDSPPFTVLQEFVHLLDFRDQDYSEETELQQLRMEIVQMMDFNQKLQSQVDALDTEVGLLVRNKITIMNDHQRSARLSKLRTQSITESVVVPEKETAELLDSVGNIVYILQTKPAYLYRLLIKNQYNKTTHNKLKNLIMICFNHGTHKREEYLLAKFLSYSVWQEVKELGDQGIESFLGTENYIFDMGVQMMRSQRYSDYRVKDFIEELLNPILEKHVLRIKTDPVLIYKNCVFQKEAEEGVSSGLPYNVTVKEALEYGNVKELLKASYKRLIQAVVDILNKIFGRIDVIPYGVRFMAKTLLNILRNCEPKLDENTIWMAISNIVYFRYLNMAVVVPESFGAFTSSIDTIISNDQRFNLAEVGRLVQILASGLHPEEVSKGFLVRGLDAFFEEWRPKFRKFLQDVCHVDDPDVHFHFDEFMDARLLSSPQITISAHNLIEFYNIMDEFTATFEDKDDHVLTLLKKVGPIDSMRLIGSDDPSEMLERLISTEHVITLKNTSDGANEGLTQQQGMFIRCKIMLCKIICCQPGNSVEEILTVPATESQEKLHQFLCSKQVNIPESPSSAIFDMARAMSLEELKQLVKRDTATLVDEGYITAESGYQVYVRNIISDIRNKRKHALVRRKEISHIKMTLRDLESKRQFKLEQLDYYNKYIQAILESQPKKLKKNVFSRARKPKLKYVGTKLWEKGVLMSVSGIVERDFKKLQIVIEEGEEAGSFLVTPLYLGVAMKVTGFTFQNLLELQRGGIGTILLDRATCNVNLLIHLINKKFYSN